MWITTLCPQETPIKPSLLKGMTPTTFLLSILGEVFNWQLPDLDTSEVAYRMAAQAYSKAGRTVVDATRGGKLTIFPKVDYDALF